MNIEQLAIEHGINFHEKYGVYYMTADELEAFAKALQQQSEPAIIVHQVASPLYTAMVKSLADLPEGTKLFTQPPNTVSLEQYNKLLDKLKVIRDSTYRNAVTLRGMLANAIEEAERRAK